MAVSAQMLTCWLIVLMLWPSCAASSCSVTRSSLCASCTFACSTVSRVSRDTSVVSSCSCDEKSWIPSLTSATCARGGTVGRWDGGRAGAGDGCEPDGGPCPKATTTRSSSLKRAAAPGRIAGWEWFTSLLRFVGYHPRPSARRSPEATLRAPNSQVTCVTTYKAQNCQPFEASFRSSRLRAPLDRCLPPRLTPSPLS